MISVTINDKLNVGVNQRGKQRLIKVLNMIKLDWVENNIFSCNPKQINKNQRS